jgi:hypothetical protein
MILRLSLVSCMLLHAGILCADDYKLAPVEAAPTGLTDEIAGQFDAQALRLTGPDGDVFDLWLLKSLPVQEGFSPTLMVKYPFTAGQLIGALRVADGSNFTDFRGQDVPPGVYTLRFGLQPQDGNHIGTSEVSDFLLALPAKIDKAPAVIDDFDTLAQRSAQSVGSTHPAIFSMLSADDPIDEAGVTHDEDFDYWILNLVGTTAGGKKIPMRVVVIGEAGL